MLFFLMHNTLIMNFNGIFITDFDGTLYDHAFGFDEQGLLGLEELKRNRFLRVVATGRSNFRLHREIDLRAFADYVIFASGSVIYDCAADKLLHLEFLPEAKVHDICRILRNELKLNFMVQNVWPNNHTFKYWPQESQIEDFRRRVALFAASSEYMPELPKDDATEIITIINPERKTEVMDILQSRFPYLNIITATSPLDKTSIWLEIFPQDVSKSKACARLLTLLQLKGRPTAAVGNDYNDLDMLHWADYGFVVSNAPRAIWGDFEVVSKSGEGGVREAALTFMQRIKR